MENHTPSGVTFAFRVDFAQFFNPFTVSSQATGRMYAVREFEIPVDRSAREVNKMWAEFDAHAVLDHPNISRLQEVFCSEERYHVVTDLLRWVRHGAFLAYVSSCAAYPSRSSIPDIAPRRTCTRQASC